jgi:cytochrome c553
MGSGSTSRRTLLSASAALAVLLAAPSSPAADPRQIVTTVCAACHGEDGNSPAPNFPKLAGLQADYIVKQLKDLASGKRNSEVMSGIVANLSADDFSGLAAYFSAQKAAPGKVDDANLAAAGRKVFDDGNTTTGVPACVGCHQPGAVGNERFPRLAGQHQAYTLQALTELKSGQRANDRGRVMRAVAERMTDDEMKAVAEYLAGLR